MRYSPELKQKAIDLYNCYKNYAKVGKELNINPSTIKFWIDPNQKIKFRNNYLLNKNIILEKNRKYRLKKSVFEKRQLYNKKYNKINKEKKRQYALIYDNLPYRKEYKKQYRLKNKKNINKYQNNYETQNWYSDPKYKITKICRHRLLSAIKLSKQQKNFKTGNIENLIGCTIDHLKQHLESKFQPGMSWSNHSYRGWHIDHIIPCTKFDLTNEEQRKQCFHWSNLQPLWMSDNLNKGG